MTVEALSQRPRKKLAARNPLGLSKAKTPNRDLIVSAEAALSGGESKPEGRKDGGKWIAGAIKHPGALHRALHVPEGEKIPAKKLAKAEHSDSLRLRKEANLAEELKGFKKGGK